MIYLLRTPIGLRTSKCYLYIDEDNVEVQSQNQVYIGNDYWLNLYKCHLAQTETDDSKQLSTIYDYMISMLCQCMCVCVFCVLATRYVAWYYLSNHMDF